jgi:hypothetical protein
MNRVLRALPIAPQIQTGFTYGRAALASPYSIREEVTNRNDERIQALSHSDYCGRHVSSRIIQGGIGAG